MKNINRFLISISSIFLLLLLHSCKEEKTGKQELDTTKTPIEIEINENQSIHLTREQMDAIKLTLGDFEQVKINGYIKTSGTLGLPPNAYSSLSAKASGFIKNSNKYVEGSFVKKGVTIAYLENPEFIKQQQQYLEVTAELTFLKKELERQQSLVNADAGVIKNVEELQSKVDMKTATQKGMAQQLAYMGIKTASLTPEHIVNRIAITAPMTGYITSISMHDGMYVKPEIELMEIVTDNHLHLELDVFEKDIAQLEEGQKITYTVPALGSTVYKGEVHIIGREFNSENKTIRVHGHLEKFRPRFIKDLFIEAKIWLNDQTVEAVPEGAIMRDGGTSYVFVTNNKEENGKVAFLKLAVMPNATDKGYTAIRMIDAMPSGMQVVTEGAYYVFAQSQLGEGGEE